jgi:hypothetical protein
MPKAGHQKELQQELTLKTRTLCPLLLELLGTKCDLALGEGKGALFS